MTDKTRTTDPSPPRRPGARTMAATLTLAVGAFALGLAAPAIAPASAQDAKAAGDGKTIQLTPEEIQEREGRKACKVAICAAFHVRKPGPDITCSVLKTWRKEQLEKVVAKAKLGWPWGAARCTADIKLPREGIIKAMTEAEHTLVLDNHTVKCELDRSGAEKYSVQFSLAPKVTFKQGKAVLAKLGWGKVDAPLLAKTALWSATATDNTLNVLQSTVIEDINDFVEKKCNEVKTEWAAK
jgi:hypothetical protein